MRILAYSLFLLISFNSFAVSQNYSCESQAVTVFNLGAKDCNPFACIEEVMESRSNMGINIKNMMCYSSNTGLSEELVPRIQFEATNDVGHVTGSGVVNVECASINSLDLGKAGVNCDTLSCVNKVLDSASAYPELSLRNISTFCENSPSGNWTTPKVTLEMAPKRRLFSNKLVVKGKFECLEKSINRVFGSEQTCDLESCSEIFKKSLSKNHPKAKKVKTQVLCQALTNWLVPTVDYEFEL